MIPIVSYVLLFTTLLSPVKAKLEFKEYEKSFGSIKEGKIINVVYEFENRGKAPLIIKDVQSSCGCTAVAFPSYPVAAGTGDFITVKFISLGKSGVQDKEIKVISNDPRGVVKLRLTGKVLGH